MAELHFAEETLQVGVGLDDGLRLDRSTSSGRRRHLDSTMVMLRVGFAIRFGNHPAVDAVRLVWSVDDDSYLLARDSSAILSAARLQRAMLSVAAVATGISLSTPESNRLPGSPQD